MQEVRAFCEQDIPDVVMLHRSVFGTSSGRTPAALGDYFSELLFRSPWHDPSLPSLVAVEGSRIVGFLGVMPRPMMFGTEHIRAAACTQFMVDPSKASGLAAMLLLKKFFSGPQDLSIADGANDTAYRLWVAMGGSPALLYSLHWLRPLRPAAGLLSLARQRAKSGLLSSIARPFAAVLDFLAARAAPNRFTDRDSLHRDGPVSIEAVVRALPIIMSGKSLQPVYGKDSLTWLLQQAARKTRYGPLQTRCVRDDEGALAGWYFYYCRPGHCAEVLQLVADRGKFDAVMNHLLSNAWLEGATAVRGRMDPLVAKQLSDRHCWFRRDGPWTLLHSRRKDVLASAQGGDAFLSRLDAEWWMSFTSG